MKRKHLFLLTFLAVVLVSCNPQDPYIPAEFSVGHGLLVLNEGPYQYASSSLTFYDPEADTSMNNLFKRVNFDLVQTLGDVAQSMAIADGKLFIVVNNSNLIYKMDANTIRIDTSQPFKLTDFYSPREMLFVAPNKAYVSDLYGSQLWIVNPLDMSHSGSIEMGKATEKMLLIGNELYVSNWSNSFVPGEKNTVQVVDINNDVKVAEITVGKEPNCMAVDNNGHVWVLCEGATWEADGENPSLWEIDPMLKNATKRYEFDGTAMIMKANASGTALFVFYNNEVRRFDIATSALSESFTIVAPEGGTFYNMAVNPQNGELYVTDAKNYMMNGTVYRYTEDGLLLSSFEAGIIPSAMLFK